MTSKQERDTIIGLLATDKISVKEAEMLLYALNADQPDGIEMEFYTEQADLGPTLKRVSSILQGLSTQV